MLFHAEGPGSHPARPRRPAPAPGFQVAVQLQLARVRVGEHRDTSMVAPAQARIRSLSFTRASLASRLATQSDTTEILEFVGEFLQPGFINNNGDVDWTS